MEEQVPQPEIIQKIYKDKTTDRKTLISSTPKNILNRNENNKINEIISPSKNSSSKEIGKKRRQGLWFNNKN